MAAGPECALKSVLGQNQLGDCHWPQTRKMTSNRQWFQQQSAAQCYLLPNWRVEYITVNIRTGDMCWLVIAM
jgi:hypothetical protein